MKLVVVEGSEVGAPMGDRYFSRYLKIDILLQADITQCIIGVQILNMLVLEMNESESVKPLTRHRKIASSFRDTTLFNIFQLQFALIEQTTLTDNSNSDDNMQVTFTMILMLYCVNSGNLRSTLHHPSHFTRSL